MYKNKDYNIRNQDHAKNSVKLSVSIGISIAEKSNYVQKPILSPKIDLIQIDLYWTEKSIIQLMSHP